jgi:hypothetical protein
MINWIQRLFACKHRETTTRLYSRWEGTPEVAYSRQRYAGEEAVTTCYACGEETDRTFYPTTKGRSGGVTWA